MVADNIRRLREERGLTQEQLSALCKKSRTACYQWESRTGSPTVKTLKIIAQVLEVPFEELIKE